MKETKADPQLGDLRMSHFKSRIGSTNLSNSLRPRPGNHAASPVVLPDSLAPDSSPATPSRQADLVCLADVEPRPIDWLWKDRLAAGTLSVLSGDPGSGKTWIALAVAAALSRGREPASLPGSRSADPCTILYAAGGNGVAEVLRPRFAALHGDPAQLTLLRGALSADSPQTACLSLRDTPVFEDALEKTRARLLIIDALHRLLWDDRHRANDDGPVFDGLASLAETHRCCVLVVRHIRSRSRGALPIELSAAVRTAFLAGASIDAPSRPALVQIKSNLGRLAPSLGYSIANNGVFTWSGPSKLTPEELMTDHPIGAGLPLRRLAAAWLCEHLRDGQRSQYSVEAAAKRDGICLTTLRRAKSDIGVVSTKETYSGCWNWTLPENKEAAAGPLP
jgi:putative DNA primase/helicase